MIFYFTFVLIFNAILMVQNAPIPPLMTRTTSTGCIQYTIINTRGTDEPQGESVAVRPMNQQVISSMSGGKIVSTVYSAGNTQNSEEGSQAIMNVIHSALQQNPNECIVLEGYSQGAAATTYAMPRMDQTSFDAVKAVVLLGNPMHRADSQSNAVMTGNDGMRGGGGGSGLQSFQGGIPNNWVDKTLDVCEPGDPICQGGQGGDWSQHTKYAYDNNAQIMAANFILKHLSGSNNDCQTNPPSTSTPQPQTSNQGITNNPYSSYNPYSAYSMPQQTASSPWSQPSTGYGPNRFSGYSPSQQTGTNRYPAYSWPPSGYGASRSSESSTPQSTRSGTDPSSSWTSFIPSFLTSKHT